MCLLIYLHLYIIGHNHPHNVIITSKLFTSFGTEIYFVGQWLWTKSCRCTALLPSPVILFIPCPRVVAYCSWRSGSKQMPHEPSIKYLHKIYYYIVIMFCNFAPRPAASRVGLLGCPMMTYVLYFVYTCSISFTTNIVTIQHYIRYLPTSRTLLRNIIKT